MKMLNVKIDDWTHKNLKALAALKEMSVSSVLKFLVGKEITDNPEECSLCLRYGYEPNEETIKAFKDKSGKTFKTVAALMKDLTSDE